MKFCIHLSTRIQDKRNELPLINLMTDLALKADAGGKFSAISLTEHHLHENQAYQNSLLFACALAPRLTQATLILATVNPAMHHPVRLVEFVQPDRPTERRAACRRFRPGIQRHRPGGIRA